MDDVAQCGNCNNLIETSKLLGVNGFSISKDNPLKIKLTDSYGNDLLDENGCLQYVTLELDNIDKETVYYALSRLLDEDIDQDEFNYISNLRDKFSVNK